MCMQKLFTSGRTLKHISHARREAGKINKEVSVIARCRTDEVLHSLWNDVWSQVEIQESDGLSVDGNLKESFLQPQPHRPAASITHETRTNRN